MENAEMVKLGSLLLACTHSAKHEQLGQLFEKELDQIPDNDVDLVNLAGDLLAGRSHIFSSDDPECLQRCRVLAEHMDAIVIEVEKDELHIHPWWYWH